MLMKKKTLSEFVCDARKVHGDEYDYSNVSYITNGTKVCIICHKHGDFYVTPNHHLRGCGCQKCADDERRDIEAKAFLDKAKSMHNGKYDYSNVNYINNHIKVEIICPKHGSFMQTPKMHLSGSGCQRCGQEHKAMIKIAKNREAFIPNARKVHGAKYDYSKVVYDGHRRQVCIICPTHGEFWQTPEIHLNGGNCQKCNQSQLEEDVELALIDEKVDYRIGKKFPWLGLQHLDFYLPKYNVAIECQGEQHYKSIDYFGGDERLKKSIERDNRKLERCTEHGVKILYYSKSKLAPKGCFNNISDLIECIKHHDR